VLYHQVAKGLSRALVVSGVNGVVRCLCREARGKGLHCGRFKRLQSWYSFEARLPFVGYTNAFRWLVRG